jgi:hypothetical protein
MQGQGLSPDLSSSYLKPPEGRGKSKQLIDFFRTLIYNFDVISTRKSDASEIYSNPLNPNLRGATQFMCLHCQDA